MHGRKTRPKTAAERAKAQPVSRRSALKTLGVAVPTALVAGSAIIDAPRAGALTAIASLALGTVITPSGDATGATDYNAIQAALTAAIPGGTVILAPGIYYINAPLVLTPSAAATTPVPGPSLIALNAQGHIGDNLFPNETSQVQIIAASGFPLGKFMLDYQQNATSHVGFSGVWIKGIVFNCAVYPSQTNTAAGVRLQGPRQFHVEDITVTKAAQPAGYTNEAVGSVGGFTVNTDDVGTSAGAYNLFERITASNCALDGIHHNANSQDTFLGCHILSNRRRGITTQGSGSQATFINCDSYVAPGASAAASAYYVEGVRNVFLACSQALGSCPYNCLVLNNDNGGGSNPPYEQARFIGMHFENSPAAAPGEQNGSVINITGANPAATFIGCSIIAHANTSDFVYVSNAVGGGGPVDFKNSYFGGTPATNKFHDLSTHNVLRFSGCDGINPVGVVSLAVPTSGKAVPAQAYDRTFYVTAAARRCTMAIQGGPSVVIPHSQMCAVRVPAGHAVTPTYTSKPSWVVQGE
jgi:hypothetical protein